MPSNPHRPGAAASTSFRASEVMWLDQVLAIIRRGGDARDLMRRDPGVQRKVESMKASLRRQREVRS